MQNKKITVSGLQEIEETDLFQYVTVEFLGVAPDATAQLYISGDLSADWFTIDQTSGLDVGDVVTVSISESYVEEIIQETGMRPSELSKEYTVDTSAQYATSFSEVTDEAMESMKQQAVDVYDAYVEDTYTDTEEFLGLDYVGAYFLTAIDGQNAGNSNMMYLVYKGSVKNDESDAFTFYWYCKFTDLVVSEDGTCNVDLSSYDTPDGYLSLGMTFGEVVTIGNYYYSGYESLDALFEGCVASNSDNYTYASAME